MLIFNFLCMSLILICKKTTTTKNPAIQPSQIIVVRRGGGVGVQTMVVESNGIQSVVDRRGTAGRVEVG